MALNDQQSLAATTLAGLVLVDAGAGSGKTRALTQRFVNAVDPDAGIDGWEPLAVDEVVAITFTDKAAGELAERIRASLRTQRHLAEAARRVDVAWISTIHGLCSRILREHALRAGIDPQFGVADSTTAGELAERCFEAVARAALESDGDAETLFAEYGYASVFGAVSEIRHELIKRGLGAQALDIEPVDDPERLLAEAIDMLATTADRVDECGDERDSVTATACACREVSERLCGLDASRTPAADVGRAVWSELKKVPVNGRLQKGEAAPVLADFSEQRTELRQRALALALHGMTRALVALTGEYDRAFAVAKRDRSLLDFDDLQLLALHLLAEQPDLAEAYRERFGLVMVDEFQDTDSLQLQLVRALSGPNLCTVGDERQSIYRFRGAEIEVYRGHRDRARALGVEPIGFFRNYRSHPEVLACVNRVFSSDEYFGPELMRLEASRDEPEPPVLTDIPRVEVVVVDRQNGKTDESREREAAEVADRFAALRSAGIDPGDMTVLVRAWSKAPVFAEALRARGFTVIVGGGDFLGRPEVQLVRAMLRAIANPQDAVALQAVLASPLGGMSATGLWRLGRTARERRVSLWDVAGDPGLELDEADRAAMTRVAEAISQARESVGDVSLGELILRAVTRLGYDLVLLSDGPEGKQRFVNVLKLARLADAFERAGHAGVASFVAHLDTKERLGDDEKIASLADDGSPAVRIMSIHSAKGLEFPVVAVVGLADGRGGGGGALRVGWEPEAKRLRLALRLSGQPQGELRTTKWFDELAERDDAADAEEDMRLAYVALTRAKEYLLLSGGAPVAKLRDPKASCYRTPLGSMLRALGALERVELERDEVVDAGDLQFRLRCVDGDPPVVDRDDGRQVGTQISEAELADHASAALPGVAARVEEVSFSALSAYEQCPRRYWARSILRLGWLEPQREPEGGAGRDLATEEGVQDALTFGSAVHFALEQAIAHGAELGQEQLDDIATMYGLTREGRERLAPVAASALGSGAVRAARDLGTPRVEVPFALELGDDRRSLILRGFIDLYVRSDDGRALIVDYKTGAYGDSDGVREHYGLQASCYALAALADGVREVEARYVRPEVPDGDDIETTVFGPFTAEDAPRLKEQIREVVDRIDAGAFEPRPSKQTCRECAIPRGLCPEAWGP